MSEQRPIPRWVWYLLVWLLPIEFLPFWLQIALGVVTFVIVLLIVKRKRAPR